MRRLERLIVALAIGKWWAVAAVIGGAVAIIALSVLLWWLLFSNRWAFVAVEATMCIAAIVVRSVLQARYRLSIRREKKMAREDWPSAIAREQSSQPARSTEQEN